MCYAISIESDFDNIVAEWLAKQRNRRDRVNELLVNFCIYFLYLFATVPSFMRVICIIIIYTHWTRLASKSTQ